MDIRQRQELLELLRTDREFQDAILAVLVSRLYDFYVAVKRATDAYGGDDPLRGHRQKR
jgi:hypothetical protein